MNRIITSKTIYITIAFFLTGFIIYCPILNNTFLSDDYNSLYRILIEKRIIYREFLRPMIDISFYFNYLLSGLSAKSYYIFNVTVHILNALLLYRFTLKYELFEKKDQQIFALISGFFFLIYPFHNESIAWLSGRLSSMAFFFGFLSLNISMDRRNNKGFLLSAFFFYVGMLCYESIIVLPAIIITLNWNRYKTFKTFIRPVISWILVVIAYLVIRRLISGEVYGRYGGSMMEENLDGKKIINAGKIIGRLFLPPTDASKWLVTGFITVALFFLFFNWILIKRNFKRINLIKYAQLIIALLISISVPIAFGISTRTSELDRLLYLPSCFICILISALIIASVKKKTLKGALFTVISIYFIFFTEKNNRQWVKASDATNEILRTIKNSTASHVTLINLPNELEGAYVFRMGFRECMIFNHIDSTRLTVTNSLIRADYIKVKGPIEIKKQGSLLLIYPAVTIQDNGDGSIRLFSTDDNITIALKKERNSIYYWNKTELIRVF